MSSSRPAPRHKSTNVVRGRNNPGSTKNSSRHWRLWEAIRSTQHELAQWQQQADQVQHMFRQTILPREENLTSLYCDLTESLINHFDTASLSDAEQALLSLWVTANFAALNQHPFVSVTRRDSLLERWRFVLSEDAESDIAAHARRTIRWPGAEEDELDENDTIFEFGMHKTHTDKVDSEQPESMGQHPSSSNKAGNHNREDSPHHQRDRTNHPDEAFRQAQHAEDSPGYTGAEKVAETLDNLEQRLSIDKLFRQLASVLHPDREQDEALKEEKNRIMGLCLKARQDKDINTLLTLYCEHVGELPDDLDNTSHEDLVKALELQLKELQQLLRQQRFGDPLLNQAMDRYGGTGEAQCNNRIEQHAQALDLEILSLQQRLTQLQSKEGLAQALSDRKELEQDRLTINQMTGYR